MQQSLQKASFALLSACDKRFLQLAVKSQVETKEMLAHSVDAIALAGHMSSKLSTLGREHLKPSLRPEFHAICTNNATTISNLLFNLAEQIRDAKETNRLAKTRWFTAAFFGEMRRSARQKKPFQTRNETNKK